MRAVVKSPHKSEYPNPISFNKGECLLLGRLDTEFEGWIRTITNDGNEGWAPVDYIEINECKTTGIAKCEYNALELNTTINESLTVLAELCEWILVVNSQGNKGWVPLRSVNIK